MTAVMLQAIFDDRPTILAQYSSYLKAFKILHISMGILAEYMCQQADKTHQKLQKMSKKRHKIRIFGSESVENFQKNVFPAKTHQKTSITRGNKPVHDQNTSNLIFAPSPKSTKNDEIMNSFLVSPRGAKLPPFQKWIFENEKIDF